MKTYLLLLFVLLTGCLGLPTPPPAASTKVIVPLKLTADSGYLLKKDILLFLEANELADTLNTWWKQWKPTDTLGKYYKTDDDSYLACVLVSDDKGNVEGNKLIAIDKKGIYQQSVEFYCDWCDINRRTEALQKKGNYFITYTCGNGASFSSSWFCLFRKISERDESNQLLEYEDKGVPDCQSITSDWHVSGDSCIMAYTLKKGTLTEEGCTMGAPVKVNIIYRRVNGRWAATDSSKLKQLNVDRQ